MEELHAAIREASCGRPEVAAGWLAALHGRLAVLPATVFTAAVLRDLCSDEESEGQVGKAFSGDNWCACWDCSCTQSVVHAHELCFCQNFKDQSVQGYGEPVFRAVQERAKEVFCSIPPPEPSDRSHLYGSIGPRPGGSLSGTASGGHGAPRCAARQRNMRAFYDVSGGCLHGDSPVLMADGSTKPVRALHRGDPVATPAGGVAAVQCVEDTVLGAGGDADFVHLGRGLRITPWHPVLIDGAWQFPADIKPARRERCHSHFSFLLEGNAPAMVVVGVAAICLAHGLRGDCVAPHPYLGTDAVARDLATLPGWGRGHVRVAAASTRRDPATGHVCGLGGVGLGKGAGAQGWGVGAGMQEWVGAGGVQG